MKKLTILLVFLATASIAKADQCLSDLQEIAGEMVTIIEENEPSEECQEYMNSEGEKTPEEALEICGPWVIQLAPVVEEKEDICASSACDDLKATNPKVCEEGIGLGEFLKAIQEAGQ